MKDTIIETKYGPMKVIEDRNAYEVEVEFVNTGTRVVRQRAAVKVGRVRDPQAASVIRSKKLEKRKASKPIKYAVTLKDGSVLKFTNREDIYKQFDLTQHFLYKILDGQDHPVIAHVEGFTKAPKKASRVSFSIGSTVGQWRIMAQESMNYFLCYNLEHDLYSTLSRKQIFDGFTYTPPSYAPEFESLWS